jgi:cation diffusion facilitator family transporter
LRFRTAPHDPDQPIHFPAHAQGVEDPAIFSTRRGIQAVQWSFYVLLATACFQVVAVIVTGSVGLFADTIHNFGDAATAIPLWFAFRLARRRPSKQFTYGYGRVEDLAGMVIVLTILSSAVFAAYESLYRLFYPKTVEHIGAVMLGSVIGFLGNEAVARFRIRVGREIGSAALVADGSHARVDGLASLTVLFGAMAIGLGYPSADPLAGLLLTVITLRIVWESGRSVFGRLLDGVDPGVVDEIQRIVSSTPQVREVSEVRVRWLGHRLHAEVNVAVNPELPVEQGHRIATLVQHELLHHLPYLSATTVHVDPVTASGERHHRIDEHAHDELTTAHPPGQLSGDRLPD